MPKVDVCADCDTRLTERERDRFVLVSGGVRQQHCSEGCLRVSLRRQQIARARIRRTVALSAAAVALVVGGAGGAWLRFHAPPARSISHGWAEKRAAPEPAPGPAFFGPAWPPTDADWTLAFAKASWVYPLPGPVRRTPKVDARVFGPAPPADRPASCRTENHCGVDLGGELWGEHVYAALDGVVERVQADGNEERGGLYVRISHLGGMVFTQYFHLAATSPSRRMRRGSVVKAGEVIGLVGDTGTKSGRRHLHFALSVRPSPALPEVYWDPTPLMAGWPLRTPAHGTVAGLTP
jgi:murein DD-endopeptidase MepM/ murein hydrolase activator NlpD